MTMKINKFVLCSQITYHEIKVCSTSHRLLLIDNAALRHDVSVYACFL